MTALYDKILQYIFLTAIVALASGGCIIALVMGFCFLREYVHTANERWTQIRKDEDDY